jgi:hypothetical protein
MMLLAVALTATQATSARAGHWWGHDERSAPAGRLSLRPAYSALMVPRRNFYISGYAGASYPPGRLFSPTGYGYGSAHGHMHSWYGR